MEETDRIRKLTSAVRLLAVGVVLLLGVVVGEVAGILAVVNGASIAGAFAAGGVAFAGTATLGLLVRNELAK